MVSVKHAVRTLFRTPFVTAVAVLSLALGIGANTAIFSLFEELLLRPLTVSDPDRLVNIAAPGPIAGSTSCNQAGGCESVFSYPMFRDLEREVTGLAGIAAHRLFGANVAYRGQTLNAEGMLASGSYFPLLGVRPALGRLLAQSDDQAIGAHPVAVLSYDFWHDRLGGSRDVLDATIVVNGQSFTIVGVAPRGFHGTTLGARPLVYVPLTMRGVISPGFDGFENRRSYWAYLFGRLAPGSSIERAAAAINGVYRPIINDVEAPLQQGASEDWIARFRAKQITLEPGSRGQSSVHAEAKTPLALLLATTGIVLLIACANIANLLLARGANRGMEMAVRLSLGASRTRITTQLLTEACVLALMGGVASLLIARWTLAGIAAILPPDATASLQLELRPSVLAFAAALSIGTGLLFGTFPALHATRAELVSSIRANAGHIVSARAASRFRSGLVIAQIALSMALLITAGLFLKSLRNVSRVDLGLEPENVIAFGVSPELNGYEPERSKVLFARLEEELAALPGVTGVSAGLVPLLTGSNWANDVSVEGFQRGPDIDSNSRFNMVGPAYFPTLGIALLNGREFTVADGAGGARVAVVNEAFARKFDLGRDAVGKRMAIGGTDALDIEIIGLVRDAKYSDVKDEVPPLYFVPWRQDDAVGSLTFYVRTATDPAQVLRAVPGVVAKLDPNLPIEQLKTLAQQVRENVFLDRMISMLSATFAALATLLAAVGLYGVLAYTVAQRTREIGVRMALGADRGSVRAMVLRQVARMFLVGTTIGILTAVALGRAAQSLLFGLDGQDAGVIALATLVLALFALGAGLIPAARAARVHPMQALRYE